MPSPVPPLPAKDAFARLLDGLQTFIREHLALARAEAKVELKAVLLDFALSAAGVPLLFTGYLLFNVAAALLLATALQPWAAFALVAFANLAGGALLTVVWGRKAARDRVGLPDTADELERSRSWIAQLKTATNPAPAARAEPAPVQGAKGAAPLTGSMNAPPGTGMAPPAGPTRRSPAMALAAQEAAARPIPRRSPHE